MKQVYLLYGFNPYHNRRIIKFNTVAEYLTAADSYTSSENPKNFAYRDGISTTMQVKIAGGGKSPDYLLIVAPTTQAIESRWFVLQADQQSENIFVLTLRRDTVADYYNDIITAPTFIEKATVQAADPFIFNQEEITVNRIKKDETLLKDASKCAWVVGYLATDYTTTNTTINFGNQMNPDYTYADMLSFAQLSPIADYANIVYQNQSPSYASLEEKLRTKYLAKVWWKNEANTSTPFYVTDMNWTANGTVSGTWSAYATTAAMRAVNTQFTQDTVGYIKNTILLNSFKNELCNKITANQTAIQTQIKSIHDYSTSQCVQMDGKIIQIGSKLFEVRKWKVGSDVTDWYDTFGNNGSNAIQSAINSASWNTTNSIATPLISIGCLEDKYQVVLYEITSGTNKIMLTGGEKNLNNIPYKMFMIPYAPGNNIKFKDYDNNDKVMEGSFALQIANGISTKYSGAGALYDLQILPYCPEPSYIYSEYDIRSPLDQNSKRTNMTNVYDSADNVVGCVFWATSNQFTINIPYTISVDDVKLDSITEMYRLSSPNWNGQFEFNPAKNGGVTYFNIDCTYKPHTPYIHINPDFGRLYGQDFDDARGLICAGDFSLPQISSAWNTYELQNKNYQNQFQRDIENLELTQSINMKKQIAGAVTGTVSGAMSGAMSGGLVGGIGGAIAGGIIGAAASAAGAAMDIGFQKQLNAEAIDYRKDQFGFQLENIKALPQNLTNAGALTANNKIWPILEHYSCTDEEKAAVEAKLYYNGMSVNRIDQIGNYLQADESYIKGKLIRLTIPEDNHFVEAIAEELDKGVFIK